jgi:hypothetical protein
MNHIEYHVEVQNEMLVSMIDKEFSIVNVVGNPEDGLSDGYNLSIFDPRCEDRIIERIGQLEKKKV